MAELVLSRAAVRELDRRAIEELGVPSIVLMENAGRACAFEALALVHAARSAKGAAKGAAKGEQGAFVVCAGPGNNGGDGFVVARTLVNHGREARVFFLGGPAELAAAGPDVRTNATAWRAMGGGVDFLDSDASLAALRAALAGAPLVVDALFGTGLSRPLRGLARDLIETLDMAGKDVLAVDVPSGLDADTGAVLGAAVRASVTVTFVAQKSGFALAEGPARCGRVVVAEIGIPRPLLEEALRSAGHSGG